MSTKARDREVEALEARIEELEHRLDHVVDRVCGFLDAIEEQAEWTRHGLDGSLRRSDDDGGMPCGNGCNAFPPYSPTKPDAGLA